MHESVQISADILTLLKFWIHMDLNDAIEFNSFSSSLETQNETGCDSAEVFCGHDTSYNQYRSIFRDTGMHVSFAQ